MAGNYDNVELLSTLCGLRTEAPGDRATGAEGLLRALNQSRFLFPRLIREMASENSSWVLLETRRSIQRLAKPFARTCALRRQGYNHGQLRPRKQFEPQGIAALVKLVHPESGFGVQPAGVRHIQQSRPLCLGQFRVSLVARFAQMNGSNHRHSILVRPPQERKR